MLFSKCRRWKRNKTIYIPLRKHIRFRKLQGSTVEYPNKQISVLVELLHLSMSDGMHKTAGFFKRISGLSLLKPIQKQLGSFSVLVRMRPLLHLVMWNYWNRFLSWISKNSCLLWVYLPRIKQLITSHLGGAQRNDPRQPRQLRLRGDTWALKCTQPIMITEFASATRLMPVYHQTKWGAFRRCPEVIFGECSWKYFDSGASRWSVKSN